MNTTLRKLVALTLVAFGVFCFLKGLPSSVTRDAATVVIPKAVASVHSERPALPAAASVKTRAIQDIHVGQRVLAKNPEISNLERRARRAEPEFSNWLQLSLEMPKSDGSTLHIGMLRSEEWLRNQLGFVIGEVSSGERHGVSPPCTTPTPDLNPPSPQTENLQPKTELAPLSPLRPIYSDIAFASVAAEAEGVELVGLTVDLDLPEMGACGTAVITGISTTPEIEQGEGQVVTATFRHPPSNTVLDVVFVDEGTNLDQHGLAEAETTFAPADVIVAPKSQPDTSSKPIGVTDNHLFWSEDRGEFIEIGRMDIGERVRTLFGETKILAQKLPRPGPPAEVYNLEVHEEHVYFVGDGGVLAHNTCTAARIAQNVTENQSAIRASNFGGELTAPRTTTRAMYRAQAQQARTLATQERLLGRFAAEARDELVNDFDVLADGLGESRFGAVVNNPPLMRPFFGTVLEGRVASKVAAFQLGPNRVLDSLEWTRFTNAPQDFISRNGYGFDITAGTQSSILRHLARPEVNSVIIYNPIPKDLGRRFNRYYGF